MGQPAAAMAGHGATAGRGPCISGYQYAVCVKCEKWWSWPRRCEDESTLYVPYSPTREMRFFAFPTRDNPTDTRPDPSGWLDRGVRGRGDGASRMIVPRPAAVNLSALIDGRLASEAGRPRSECLTSPEPADLWTEVFSLRIPAGSFGARGGDAHNRAEACGSKLICLDRWSPRF